MAAETNEVWKVYRASSGTFRVEYPSNWYVLQEGASRLDILSFPKEQRAHGAVLIHGGAEIDVISAPPTVRSLNEWIKLEVKDESNVVRDPIPAELKKSPFCSFTAVSYEDELGPNVWTTNKIYFCECSGRLLQVRLTTFKGELNQNFLQVL